MTAVQKFVRLFGAGAVPMLALAFPARGQTLVRMYELIELGVDGTAQTRAYGINDTGQTVGWVETNSVRHATHWHNLTTTDLHGTVHLDLKHPYVLYDKDYSEAYHISNADQIIGTARTTVKCPDNQFDVTNAFLLRAAVLTDLATPIPGDALTNLMTFTNPCRHGYDSAATFISNANHVVGWADTGDDLTLPNRVIRAFLAAPVNGQYVQAGADGGNDLLIDLGTLGASDPVSSATSVNDLGQVTGYSYTIIAGGLAAYHGFIITPNDTNADGFGDQWYVDGGGGVNMIMQDLGTLGGTNSWGRDINNLGQIVGESDVDMVSGEHYTRAFLWAGGVMADLGSLRANRNTGFSAASAINNAGTVVGWAENDNRVRHAFIYENGQMKDLNNLLYLVDEDGNHVVPGIVLTEARDINSDGVIVGWGEVRGSGGSQTRGFVLNPVWVDPAALNETNTNPPDVDSMSGTAGTHTGTSYTGAPVFGLPSHLLGGTTTDANTPTVDGTATTGLCGFSTATFAPLSLLGLMALRFVRPRRR